MLKEQYDCEYDYECKLTDFFETYKCEEDIPCEHEKKVLRVRETEFNHMMMHLIGKTVFLTKEEAEQALARMEGENG